MAGLEQARSNPISGDIFPGEITDIEAKTIFERLDVFGHGKIPLGILVERLPNSDLGHRLKTSGILYLKNIVERLERFAHEPPEVRAKLESDVTLDRIAFYEILCGRNDGYERAKQFLKVFQQDEGGYQRQQAAVSKEKEAQAEVDDLVKSNQTLVRKIQDCLNQIDEQDSKIKRLEEDIRNLAEEMERERIAAAEKLERELEALAGRHKTERDALMSVITMAETLKLQLESELIAQENLHKAYREKKDAEQEQLRVRVKALEEQIADWKRRYDELEELYKSSKQKIEFLENLLVTTNSKHADQEARYKRLIEQKEADNSKQRQDLDLARRELEERTRALDTQRHEYVAEVKRREQENKERARSAKREADALLRRFAEESRERESSLEERLADIQTDRDDLRARIGDATREIVTQRNQGGHALNLIKVQALDPIEACLKTPTPGIIRAPAKPAPPPPDADAGRGLPALEAAPA